MNFKTNISGLINVLIFFIYANKKAELKKIECKHSLV